RLAAREESDDTARPRGEPAAAFLAEFVVAQGHFLHHVQPCTATAPVRRDRIDRLVKALEPGDEQAAEIEPEALGPYLVGASVHLAERLQADVALADHPLPGARQTDQVLVYLVERLVSGEKAEQVVGLFQEPALVLLPRHQTCQRPLVLLQARLDRLLRPGAVDLPGDLDRGVEKNRSSLGVGHGGPLSQGYSSGSPEMAKYGSKPASSMR